jgi:hypothetical protein
MTDSRQAQRGFEAVLDNRLELHGNRGVDIEPSSRIANFLINSSPHRRISLIKLRKAADTNVSLRVLVNGETVSPEFEVDR